MLIRRRLATAAAQQRGGAAGSRSGRDGRDGQDGTGGASGRAAAGALDEHVVPALGLGGAGDLEGKVVLDAGALERRAGVLAGDAELAVLAQRADGALGQVQ